MHTVSSPHLLEDAKNIDPVLSTEGWQTLMTFTRESARKSFPPFLLDLVKIKIKRGFRLQFAQFIFSS